MLESTLEERGKTAMLDKVRRASQLIKVESVVQTEPLGLGHAIGCVEPTLSADEDSVAVLLPDDLVLPTGVLKQMSQVRNHYGGSVLCAIEVTPEEISAYGVFDVDPAAGGDNPDVLQVNGMVEKPKAEDARRCTPPRAVTCSTAPSSTRCAASSGDRRRGPTHRRNRAADFGGPPRPRRRAPRIPTRLGKSWRLPQGCG